MYTVIGADGREYGPASVEEIRQWQAQGRVHAQTLVRSAGDANWRPLYSYPELLPPPKTLAPSALPVTRPQSNAMATAGFVLGILSLLGGCCCCCACPFNLLAIVFSLIGLSQAQRDNDGTARVMAIVGLICGLLSFLGMFFGGLLSVTLEAISRQLR